MRNYNNLNNFFNNNIFICKLHKFPWLFQEMSHFGKVNPWGWTLRWKPK